MQIIIRYENGRTAEAVLLAAAKDTMRLAISGQADTTELVQVNGCWYAEDGAAVEFDALVAGGDFAEFCAELYPRTLTAGQSFID
jgi:hypothetical protein